MIFLTTKDTGHEVGSGCACFVASDRGRVFFGWVVKGKAGGLGAWLCKPQGLVALRGRQTN